MIWFDKFNSKFLKEKSKKELDEHYDNIELEKGDLTAMLIAAFITFMPLVIIITLIYIGVAHIFGL